MVDQKSSHKEFNELISKHRAIIYKISNAYCKDPEDQKDLVQEIIIQLWSSFHRYDDRYKFTTWMYRIALNVAISYYRKSKVRQSYSSHMEQSMLEIAGDHVEDQSEDIMMLRLFIQQLAKLDKALMILYLDGNSYSEIAKILNISTSNVGTKINRIKNSLREKFNKLQA